MSRYHIEFLKTAKKELLKLPQDVQRRIATKIDALSVDPCPPDSKKLKNGNGRLRIRVGDYRIIYRLEEDRLVILVIKIGHRRDVYKQSRQIKQCNSTSIAPALAFLVALHGTLKKPIAIHLLQQFTASYFP